MISYFNSALTSFYDWIGKVLDALIPVKMKRSLSETFLIGNTTAERTKQFSLSCI